MRSVLTFVTCHKNTDALIHVVARNVPTWAWTGCSKKLAHGGRKWNASTQAGTNVAEYDG
ncbi:hypothetical protein GCM10007242_33730 [Pigmentiphaga litoralis]|nr:hypothetical protein GCM10007242_33730 [Pigmentiphaga litoralis]